MERLEVRLSGSGGQGLILAGIVLAEAVSIYEGKNAVQSQSYGPEARGGASKAEVIISDGEIDYPKATDVNILLALTQAALDKYLPNLKNGGVLIVDDEMVPNVPSGDYKVFKLPIIKTAKEEIGRVMVANIVSLGALTAITEAAKIESVEKAVLSKVPKGTEELNKRALHAGFNLVK